MGYKQYTCIECCALKWRKDESQDFPWCYDCFEQLYPYNCKKCNKRMKKDYPRCYSCKFPEKYEQCDRCQQYLPSVNRGKGLFACTSCMDDID